MIRYFLGVIWQLIIKNPIKIVAMILAIISYNYAGSFKSGTYKESIVKEFNDGGNWVYIARSTNNSSGYEVMVSQSKEKLVDNCIVLEDYDDRNVLLWILFGLTSLVFVISTIIGLANDDGDIGWDLNRCQERYINNFIYCELEGDTFYYMAFGRLIGKSKTQLKSRSIADSFYIHTLSDLKKCPKFSTKNQKRNNILDKLGIN
jgi:hypothetical protein